MANLYAQKLKSFSSLPREERFKLLTNFNKISKIQKGIWLQYLIDPSSNAYNLGFLIKLNDGSEDSKFKKSINKTLEVHPILRSVFYEDSETQDVYLFPLSAEALNISEINLNHLRELNTHVEKEYSRPFNLREEIPIRITKIIFSSEIYYLFIFHHIAIDGQSIDILKTHLQNFYDNPFFNVAQDIGYFNYIQEEEKEYLKNSIDQWKIYYNNFEPQEIMWTPLQNQEKSGALIITRALSPEENKAVNSVVQEIQCLPFTFFHFCLSLSFYVCKGIKNLSIGTTTQNRLKEEYQNAIGLFVNTVLLKTELKPEFLLNKLIKDINENNLISISRDVVPYNELVQSLQLPALQKKFQLVLECQRQNSSINNSLFSNIDIKIYRKAKFDMSYFVHIDEKENYTIDVEFDSDIISTKEAKDLLDELIELIVRMPSYLRDKLSIKDLMKDKALSVTFGRALEHGISLDGLINNFKFNKNPAILGPTSTTFNELFQEAAKFCEFVKKNSGLNDIIAIDADRKASAIAMYFGAWLANKKVLLITNDLPKNRILLMLSEAKVCDIYSYKEGEYLKTNNQSSLGFKHSNKNSDQDTAGYIIFSSGTTGNPKGAIIEENSIINLIFSLKELISKYEIKKAALNAEFLFDASVQQILQLFLGISLYILPKEERLDIDLLINALNKYEIEEIDCTPSQLRMFFEENLFKRVPTLRLVLVGGEPLDKTLLDLIKNESKVNFINAYGPCETTVDVSFKIIDKDTQVNNIGSPILNTQIYILDKENNQVPIGEVGQLVIQGPSVGNGYLNSNKLVANPFIELDLGSGIKKTYLTGDLAYIDPHKEIFIQGRLDTQIKINGVRIEIKEIDNIASDIPGVQAAVSYFDKEKNHLILFIQTQSKSMHPKFIIECLSKHLPNYMLPNFVILRECFLLNSSGKIDCAKMLENYFENKNAANDSGMSTTLTKKQFEIASVWAKHTGVKLENIKADSDFFSIGGNSLLAFRALKELREKVNPKLKISHLLSRATLKEISEQETENNLTTKLYENIYDLNSPEQSLKTLILLHPVGGSVACYNDMAKFLEPFNIKVIGVQDDIEINIDQKPLSINVYAESVADKIYKKYKNGHILGWSFGGILSFLVAQSLLKKKFVVNSLTLVDTMFNPLTLAEYNENFGIKSFLSVLSLQKPLNIDNNELNFILNNPDFDFDKKIQKTYQLLIEIKSCEIDINYFKKFIELTNYHRQLMTTLNDTEFSEKINNFNTIYASDTLSESNSPIYNWNPYSYGELNTHIIKGDHYSIITNKEIFYLVLSILKGKMI